MKALLIKEFRENLKWFVVGLLVFSFVAYTWLPRIIFNGPYNFGSSIENGFSQVVGFLSGLFAIGLGVYQSAFDLRAGSRTYLEHRGVKSSQIVIAKILVAFTIYASAIVIPVSLLGSYLWMVGIERIPVRLLQVVPAILTAFFAFILHPIAITSLSRCASWWGTKIFPIVAALAVVAFTTIGVSLEAFEAQIWLWVLLAYIPILAIACWAAIDSWRELSLNPPTGQALSNGWQVNSVLIAGSIVCSIIVIALLSPIASYFEPAERRDYKLEFDIFTGEPWAVSIRPEDLLKSNLSENKDSVFGCKVESDKEPNDFELLPKKLKLQQISYMLSGYFRNGMFASTQYDQVYHNLNPLWTSVIDKRGYLLRYSVVDNRYPNLDSIVDRDGVHSPKSLPGNPFTHLRELSREHIGLRAFFDDNGVYALQRHRSNASEMKLHQLVEGNVQFAIKTRIPNRAKGKSQIMRLCVVVDSEIREYRLLDEDGSEEWTHGSAQKGDDDEMIENRVGELQRIRAELFQSIAIPKSIILKDIFGLLRTETGYVMQVNSFNCKHFLLGFDGKVTEMPTPSSFLVTESIDNPMNPLAPPVVGVALLLPRYIYRANRGESTELFQWILKEKSLFLKLTGIGITAVCLSMWLVNRMLVKRGISRRLRMAWLAACIALGIATPLIIASIYAVPVREKCLSCGKLRRVDLGTCEGCGASWPKNELHGIEIYDRETKEILVGV